LPAFRAAGRDVDWLIFGVVVVVLASAFSFRVYTRSTGRGPRDT